jgi:hypothetical protein
VSNDATMMQLKNSGGLRFIKKGHVADSVAKNDFAILAVDLAQAPNSRPLTITNCLKKVYGSE